MAKNQTQHSVQGLKRIMAGAVYDAQEILVLVALLREKNGGTVNNRLNAAKAGGAGAVLQNAMIARVTLLVSRCYPKPRDGDRHLHQAITLLADQSVASAFEPDTEALEQALTVFQQLKSDHRQEKIKNFRDKFTAHLGDPLERPMPNYLDLFEFAALTVQCIEKVARSLHLIDATIAEMAEGDRLSAAFWHPWSSEDGEKERPETAVEEIAPASPS